jgi:hypothetical protein
LEFQIAAFWVVTPNGEVVGYLHFRVLGALVIFILLIDCSSTVYFNSIIRTFIHVEKLHGEQAALAISMSIQETSGMLLDK